MAHRPFEGVGWADRFPAPNFFNGGLKMSKILDMDILKWDIRRRPFWAVCFHYYEKCPWALGDEGSCEIEYWDYRIVDLAGGKPKCPFKYREQL